MPYQGEIEEIEEIEETPYQGETPQQKHPKQKHLAHSLSSIPYSSSTGAMGGSTFAGIIPAPMSSPFIVTVVSLEPVTIKSSRVSSASTVGGGSMSSGIGSPSNGGNPSGCGKSPGGSRPGGSPGKPPEPDGCVKS